MIGAITLALCSPVPLRVTALPVLAIVAPEPALVALSVLLAREARRQRRERPVGEEALYLLGVAAELRAGLPLRQALVAAGGRAPALDASAVRRAVEAGRPVDDVAAAAGQALPRHGRLAVAAVRIGGVTGGRVAEAFEVAAALARSDEDLERERRAAAAQAVAGATILVGLPVAAVARQVAAGDLGGPGATLIAAGSAALAVGIAAIVALIRRSLR